MDLITLNFKFYMIILSIFYISEGLMSIFFINLSTKFTRWFYGFDSKLERKFILICKPWGSNVFIAGVLALFVFSNPSRYIGGAICLAILLSLRIYYRLRFREDIKKEFKTPLYRNYISVLLLLYGMVSILLWLIKEILLARI